MKVKKKYLTFIIFVSINNNSYAEDNLITPEPDEINYVKICDTYGKTYFTLPGTQTCMSFGGYVRTTTQIGHDAYDNTSYHSPSNSVRFTLNPKTASETELGTMKTEASYAFNGMTAKTVKAPELYAKQLSSWAVYRSGWISRPLSASVIISAISSMMM